MQKSIPSLEKIRHPTKWLVEVQLNTRHSREPWRRKTVQACHSPTAKQNDNQRHTKRQGHKYRHQQQNHRQEKGNHQQQQQTHRHQMLKSIKSYFYQKKSTLHRNALQRILWQSNKVKPQTQRI
ncbi:hypothetical protein TcCL_NonESM11502 [Trypanosoma cruzi]|nr:hypothetical protein TcCL_NonESM11502 [Trypanosoma cruzi]